VDTAAKALSPAINDPTTAVLAIDQLHRLLRLVGLRFARREIADDAGEVRVIFRTPNWDDFVHISFREIRLSAQESADPAAPDRHDREPVRAAGTPACCVTRRARTVDRASKTVPVSAISLARTPDLQGIGGRRDRGVGAAQRGSDAKAHHGITEFRERMLPQHANGSANSRSGRRPMRCSSPARTAE
jgi:hypothetical protein